jgi:hypothetical protein
MTNIRGGITSGYEPVRDACAEGFALDGEIGASLCLYVDGTPVVDLWRCRCRPCFQRAMEQPMHAYMLARDDGDPGVAGIGAAIDTYTPSRDVVPP